MSQFAVFLFPIGGVIVSQEIAERSSAPEPKSGTGMLWISNTQGTTTDSKPFGIGDLMFTRMPSDSQETVTYLVVSVGNVLPL